jgi:hypothetical protein
MVRKAKAWPHAPTVPVDEGLPCKSVASKPQTGSAYSAFVVALQRMHSATDAYLPARLLCFAAPGPEWTTFPVHLSVHLPGLFLPLFTQ